MQAAVYTYVYAAVYAYMYAYVYASCCNALLVLSHLWAGQMLRGGQLEGMRCYVLFFLSLLLLLLLLLLNLLAGCGASGRCSGRDVQSCGDSIVQQRVPSLLWVACR